MVFCFVQKYFFRQHLFFCRAEREFFFKNLTLGYMTKTLNQIMFFPPPNFFSETLGIRIFFLEKNITPHHPPSPLQVTS